MKNLLKVESKYNENLADFQVVVVTLLSNTNRTWDFIVDADAYNSLIINDYYYVTTQENWIGIIVGIRLETIAKAMHLKATVLESVRDPHDDDQVEVLDETEEDVETITLPNGVKRKSGGCPWVSDKKTEEDTPVAFGIVMEFVSNHNDGD